MNRFLFLSMVLMCLAGPAAAQRVARDCTLQKELIFDMKQAEYGAYNVWDSVFGEMNTDERFVSAVVLESGNAVAVSELSAFGKPEKILQLAEFDQRGRVLWDVSHEIRRLASIKKMLLVPEGFVIAGTMKDKNGGSLVWLGFFDKAGKLLREKTISGGNVSLLPEDFIIQTGKPGFLLSVSAGNEKTKLFHAILYHLNVKGDVADKHAYMPGMDNRIIGLSPAGRDYYMATGYLRGEDGRIQGWILQLNKDGSLVWQRQYPRGASAQINKAMPMIKDYVLAAGETEPLNKGRKAGWVMMIDGGTGNVIWQRYYTADMDQAARDVLVNMDGMGTVMMQVSRPPNAAPTEDNQDYVRLVTVNERGVLFISDEYFNGEGAQAYQLIGGRAGERIMVGRTDIVYKIEPKPGEPVETLKHGWDGLIVAAAPMETFPDECLADNSFAP